MCVQYPQYSVRQLVNPTSAELDEAANVVAAALREVNDPFIRSGIGGDWETFNYPMQRALIGAENVGGEIWVATDGERIVGVAGWYSPGRSLLDTPEQGEAGWGQFVKGLPERVGEWWMNFMPRYDNASEEAFGKGTKKGSWHLVTLCVSPEHQKRGIGHNLVAHKEAQVKADGGAMCLEADRDDPVKLYQSWGWEIKSKTWLEDSLGEDGFNLWFMYKKP